MCDIGHTPSVWALCGNELFGSGVVEGAGLHGGAAIL